MSRALSVAAVVCALLLSRPWSDAQASAATDVCPPPVLPAASTLSSPPAGQLSPQETVVACVGSRQLTEATFLHWKAIAVADAPEGSSEPHTPNAHEIVTQVMGFLLSADWIMGEASALNVHVTASEVRREFNHLRKLQFPKQREFRAFMKKTGQTVADLLFRVELNFLSERIQRRVLAGHHSSRSRERALSRFVSNFRRKWSSQTYCTPLYAVSDCGHVQSAFERH